MQLRVARVQCVLCSECSHVQSWQQAGMAGVVSCACVLGEARDMSIIPHARARECARGARRGGSSKQMADGKLGHMCGSMRAWQTVRGMCVRWPGLISEHHSARVRASERPARAAAAWPASGCAASLVHCGAMGLVGDFFLNNNNNNNDP